MVTKREGNKTEKGLQYIYLNIVYIVKLRPKSDFFLRKPRRDKET